MTKKERRHQILKASTLIMLFGLLIAVGSIITDAQDPERQTEVKKDNNSDWSKFAFTALGLEGDGLNPKTNT